MYWEPLHPFPGEIYRDVALDRSDLISLLEGAETTFCDPVARGVPDRLESNSQTIFSRARKSKKFAGKSDCFRAPAPIRPLQRPLAHPRAGPPPRACHALGADISSHTGRVRARYVATSRALVARACRVPLGAGARWSCLSPAGYGRPCLWWPSHLREWLGLVLLFAVLDFV